ARVSPGRSHVTPPLCTSRYLGFSSPLSGGRNTAKTLSELVIHDSRNSASSGFRLSSAMAPARQNQFKSSLWPRSSACSNVVLRQVSQSPARSASKYRLSDSMSGYMRLCFAVKNECDQLDDAIKATFHGLLAKARAVAPPT